MLRFLSQSKKENLGIFPTLRGPETKSLTRIFSIISYTSNLLAAVTSTLFKIDSSRYY